MLWNKGARINDASVDLVTQLLRQRLMDDAKSLPLVMADQVFDILENERPGSVVLDDPCDVEEQCSLCLAPETVFAPQSIFLRNASQRERLARKTGEQQVVCWNIRRCNFSYVASYLVIVVGKIRSVGTPAVVVPFAGEGA